MRFFMSFFMCMVVSGAYADCKILHAGDGMVCMRSDVSDMESPRLCTSIDGVKYCTSLVAGNSGGMHVAINGVTYSVPEFVKEIQFVPFDGASYIDLGFVPTTDLNFEIRADLDESVNDRDGALLGARVGMDDQYVLWYNNLGGYSHVAPRFFGNLGNVRSVSDDPITMRWENEVFTVNGEVYDIEYFVTPMNQGTVNLVFGGVRTGGMVDSRRFLGDIYYAKFWDSGGVIMDLVAATDAKGVAGMFDKVSGRMLYPVH